MASPGLPDQLEAILQQLERGVATFEVAWELAQQASDVCLPAATWQLAGGTVDEAAAMHRILDSTPSRLAPVVAALQQRLGAGEAASLQSPEQMQLQAVCSFLMGCASLVIQAGGQLAGHEVHEVQLRLARSSMRYIASVGPTLLDYQQGEEAGGGLAASLVPLRMQHQLFLAGFGMRAPGFTAAAAAQAAPPAQLAAWLAAAVKAIKWLENGSDRNLRRRLVPALVIACNALADEEAWAAHASAAAAQPGLARDVMQLCLSHASVLAVALPLPPERRPPYCSWDGAGHVLGVLSHGPLLPEGALAAYFEATGSDSAVAVTVAVAQLVLLMPLDQPPPDYGEQAHRDLAVLAASVLADICLALNQQQAVWRGLSGLQRRRIAAQLLPVVGRLPQLLQLATGDARQPSTPEHHRALRVVAAAICHLGLLWKLHKDEQAGQDWNSQQQAAPLVASRADAAQWCNAACAALQCLPLVQQLHSISTRAQQTATDELATATACFAGAAAAVRMPASGDLAGRTPTAADEALHTALWQLHSRLAQLVHLAAAADSPLAPLRDALGVERLLYALSKCMVAAMILHSADETAQQLAHGLQAAITRPRPSSPPNKLLLALGAAHAAALQACQPHIDVIQQDQLHTERMLGGLAAAIGHGPMAVGLDPALHRLFEQLWSRVQDQGQQQHSQLWLYLLYAGTDRPCYAALLTSGGHLAAILRRSGQDVLLRSKAASAVDTVRDAATRALAAAAESGGASSPDSSGAAAADEAALLDRLRQAVAAVDQSTLLAIHNQGAVPPAARRLAAALLDWWRRPGAQQEQQLEAAQAAAARSCAYLRCANLGSGSGPAAGQGEGSQRCSACRAVWYCGTGCSHADWRAGHKRVCKALGAARAAAKAARQQAAADADGQMA